MRRPLNISVSGRIMTAGVIPALLLLVVVLVAYQGLRRQAAIEEDADWVLDVALEVADVRVLAADLRAERAGYAADGGSGRWKAQMDIRTEFEKRLTRLAESLVDVGLPLAPLDSASRLAVDLSMFPDPESGPFSTEEDERARAAILEKDAQAFGKLEGFLDELAARAGARVSEERLLRGRMITQLRLLIMITAAMGILLTVLTTALTARTIATGLAAPPESGQAG